MKENIDKQKMFELQVLDQQLDTLKEHLQKLDGQIQEIMRVRQSLEDFKETKGDEKLLVPISSGIFVPAELKSSTHVKVNVGQGVVVDKTTDQAIEMITKQMAEIAQYREQMLDQFNTQMKRAEGLAREIQANADV